MTTVASEKLLEIALRIKEMREISGFTQAEMAEKTGVSLEEYQNYESGTQDFPFTFIHKCSSIFDIGVTDILEGVSAHLSFYNITRKGQGQETAKEQGIDIKNLAPLFRQKIAEPYYVKYEFSQELQNRPIHLTTHSGQEFDFVMKGCLKVQIGDHVEYLNEGDSIYYNSSTPHGMIAVNGEDCLFLAVVLPDEESSEEKTRETVIAPVKASKHGVSANFIELHEDKDGALLDIKFKNEETFNFAFDVVDKVARKDPTKLAMIHLSKDKVERRFTYDDMRKGSAQVANYFKSLGIKRGDKVMLVLKRHYQFWYSILALHKIGAIAIPATNQLQRHDYEYRFESAGVDAIVCTADEDCASRVEQAEENVGKLRTKILVGGKREGWHDFDEEYQLFSTHFRRRNDSPCGSDPMVLFFTSGTTGYPKIAMHNYKYALGHYITAKYWHGVEHNSMHFTIAETGWAKALWGKLYGQWLCEGAVFVYDFDRFDASDIMPLFKKYNITSFCAPPTILRMMIKQDLSKYDFSSIKHMTTAGEALNPEVYKQFKQITGLEIMEGFGQTEITLAIANLMGGKHKFGSMGMASPLYDVDIVDEDGNVLPDGEIGEIVIRTKDHIPCGIFMGYYNNEEQTKASWHDGAYHTGDTAWRDEDGFFWYVGRVDDVIKSSGYRIGPFEIESVIMELPYVLECGVSAEKDEIRGQIVKASIVLVEGTQGSDELVKEIQNYVKENTAPYKYPRKVVFVKELPKTISGKIYRHKL